MKIPLVDRTKEKAVRRVKSAADAALPSGIISLIPLPEVLDAIAELDERLTAVEKAIREACE